MAQDFQIKIDPQSLKNLQKVKDQLYLSVNREVENGINKVMKEVFDKSQELVPVKTGALRESGHLTYKTAPSGTSSEAEITYGDDEVDYAIFVHENLQSWHEAPTQAKYLETPMAQAGPIFKAEIQNGIRMALSKFGLASGGSSGNSQSFSTEITGE